MKAKTKNADLIKAIKSEESRFKAQKFTSINDLMAELQNYMPERGLGARYARVILNAVMDKPWQLDADLPEGPLTDFLQQKANQNDYTAMHLLQKMNLISPTL